GPGAGPGRGRRGPDPQQARAAGAGSQFLTGPGGDRERDRGGRRRAHHRARGDRRRARAKTPTQHGFDGFLIATRVAWRYGSDSPSPRDPAVQGNSDRGDMFGPGDSPRLGFVLPATRPRPAPAP